LSHNISVDANDTSLLMISMKGMILVLKLEIFSIDIYVYIKKHLKYHAQSANLNHRIRSEQYLDL